MFTFKSSINQNNIWTLCVRDKTEMDKIYYDGKPPEEGVRLHGITQYATLTIYIDKELDGYPLIKTIRHELMHIYLWETGQQGRTYSEEEVCDLMSAMCPMVSKVTDEIILRLKEGLYKRGE